MQMFLVLWKASPLGSNGDDRRQQDASEALRPAKASPFGRGVIACDDGEGKPGTKEPLHSDKQALCQSDTIAV